ncbi:MAG: hypothetical protein M3R50_00850 [Bacteroidota bacterium]|nr:hypothetical protein [Bacteroidota bacterium]
MLKNNFFEQIETVKKNNAPALDPQKLPRKGRAKEGMFDGDLQGGELEIGKVGA